MFTCTLIFHKMMLVFFLSLMYTQKKVCFTLKRPCDISCLFENSHVDVVSKWKSEFCFTDPIWSKLLPISSCGKYTHIFVHFLLQHIFSVNLILDFHSSPFFWDPGVFFLLLTLYLCGDEIYVFLIRKC